jgi:hypothetical protein
LAEHRGFEPRTPLPARRGPRPFSPFVVSPFVDEPNRCARRKASKTLPRSHLNLVSRGTHGLLSSHHVPRLRARMCVHLACAAGRRDWSLNLDQVFGGRANRKGSDLGNLSTTRRSTITRAEREQPHSIIHLPHQAGRSGRRLGRSIRPGPGARRMSWRRPCRGRRSCRTGS